MFGLFQRKNPYVQDAHHVYEQIMAHVGNADFYTKMGVPDSFDGRFDVLVVHAFMVIETLHAKDAKRASDFNQALFDQIFKYMKITLREIGVGDVGIPKHQQKMMKAFNGRMHHYSEALEADSLDAALIRNLYGTVDQPDLAEVQLFCEYMKSNLTRLARYEFDEIITSDNLFEI